MAQLPLGGSAPTAPDPAGLWAQLGGAANRRRLACRVLRVVEAQHVVATRKLVDSDEEQRLLEELLEQSKPRTTAGGEGLHYLLATPFRYPPLRHGSRFGTRHEPGIFYGAASLRTAFAEVAYYRLVFLEGSRARLAPLFVELSSFEVRVATRRGADLARPPFDAHAARLASRTSYEASQRLGRDMRKDGVEAFRYPSARDVEGGACVGVLAPSAFATTKPQGFVTWTCVATPERVELAERGFFERRSFRYERAAFLVRGKLPAPAT